MELLALASLLQRDFSGGFGVADPLRSSARGDQIFLAVQFYEIDGSGVEFAGFSSADFEEVVVGETQAETYEESEDAIEEFFNGGGFAEGGERGIHGLIIAAQLREASRAWRYRQVHRSFASLRMTGIERDHMRRSHLLHEAERGGVHAVAEPGGFGAVVEEVSEVRVAFGAGDCGADHTKSRVADFGYVLFDDGSPVAGPSGARVEFGGGVEKGVVAADAAVNAFVVKIPVFPV